MSKQSNKIKLPEIKNVIVISSGKGGVGKSTVALNTAITLAKENYAVGLIDVDIVGSSIPLMLNIDNSSSKNISTSKYNYYTPIEKAGIKLMSITFLTDQMESFKWSEPTLFNAVKELFLGTYWGELDYLIIDLAPGHGFIQQTILQKYNIDGAIILTTNERTSLKVAEKEINIFKEAEIPIIGIVENLSYYITAEMPSDKHFIFGINGTKNLAKEKGIKLLAAIPIIEGINDLNFEKELSMTLENLMLIKSIFKDIVKEIISMTNTLGISKII